MTPKLDNAIAIEVATAYLAEHSEPHQNQFVFSYTITLQNHGAIGAKLLNRHWYITDGNNQLQEVYGAGVVGEQPYLASGDRYQYSSGAVLETPVGVMEGFYEMVNDRGEHFKAVIPRFTLHPPHQLH